MGLLTRVITARAKKRARAKAHIVKAATSGRRAKLLGAMAKRARANAVAHVLAVRR